MKRSAGLLVWREGHDGVEVLLGHPGGPLFARKDTWTIPKGEYDDSEPALAAAEREFAEEIGLPAPEGERVALGEITLRSGKRVLVWAVQGEVDTGAVRSNDFELEWPPRSGRRQLFPELDRVQWFGLAAAAERVFPAQIPFLQRLAEHLNATGG